MTLDLWLSFVAASVALLMIPGPTVLLVLSYALSKGRSVALACAAGVAVGDLVAMVASLLGMGALVLASATAFMVLKWVGAIYLIWLGVSLIRSVGDAREQDGPSERAGPLVNLEDTNAISAGRVFRHAAAVTALNPKSIAFFIAFVPQFIAPQAAFLPQAGILIATFVSLAGMNALIYALAADRARGWIGRGAILAWLTRVGGVTLVGMGLLTATLKRATP